MPEPAYSEQSPTGQGSGPGQGCRPPAAVPPFLASIDVLPDGDRVTAALRGELDLDAAQWLRSYLHQALSYSVSGVDLDLHEVEFCDCSGLNLLLSLRHRALEQGKTVTLCRSSPAVERLLDLTCTKNPFTPPNPDDKYMTSSAAPHDPGPPEDTDQDLHVQVAQLRRAMQTRPTIDLARGMLMASFKLSPEAAWDVLVTTSQNTNTKLHRLAGELVNSVQGTTLPPVVQEQLTAAVAKTKPAATAPPPQPGPPDLQNTAPEPLTNQPDS
ncbi:ANTAR domain-containing protein [Streptomyces violens]|uniref:ANTAR domain-containing protein n=1 Tax=Streptomyces violens TaxID=66377 RepID=UPI000691D286|nr:ANTAR domain-containing protein [Streptomyces violens]